MECLLLICTYTYAKFIVICKLRTLNDGGEDSVKYRNRKKHRFLAAALGWLIDVDPSFALGAPEIILYKVTIDGSFSFLEKSQ